jgi:hypothetical protein
MFQPSTITLVTVTLAVATMLPTSPVSAASCESLATLKLANGAVTMAQSIAAGAFKEPGGRAGVQMTDLRPFCRVAATLAPTAESDISDRSVAAGVRV